MPLRLLIPAGIIAGAYSAGDWIYDKLRLRWYGYHRSMNCTSFRWFGAYDNDFPPPRKLDINEKNINWGKFIKYEAYLLFKFKEDLKVITEPDPEYAAIPKMAIGDDITLKQSLVTGDRERDRYIFDNITKLPGYYKRWRDRTKPQRDENAREMAENGIIVYGAPYWNGIKSSDLN
mmetsp:Transcript_20412/g.32443  ORF Transcript_20412/g.32443 Transcript_20412/m.32443 type:complete len:176 (-) Transcript_20412:385-912(-)|eukprot:CAMPEP_0197021572 /NCGR_PEP_ID=MMETSP1384-20130603/2488_1 /TAXON_ID=29189 /ORGANISM="Ammonia sp." /LENGTH=175 /DNA_ID=CAMNT_0042449429 /DNA_START=20 /DNA_END=547 /DNA_ORIENTATION=+